MLGFSLILALLADRMFGEVSRRHPLVAFGELADRVERGFRQEFRATNSGSETHWAGTLGWIVLVVPPTLLLSWLQSVIPELMATLLGIVVLYFCIGMRSLSEHARAIAQPLAHGDVGAAREKLRLIVSRDTGGLDSQAVAGATVESVLENGSDAVLAPIFWFAVAGAPGALFYRLTNTLDAMWGYRNERYLLFGRMAAWMDDLLNWIPARCCALSYALVGNFPVAWRCWRVQALLHDSPNAGPVMAAGAGALGITLGGAAAYHGERRWRPVLGEGVPVQPADIARALVLLRHATLVWVVVILLYGLLL